MKGRTVEIASLFCLRCGNTSLTNLPLFEQRTHRPENEINFLAIRVRAASGADAFFRLTRLPMGASWAPGVAQTVTWVLVEPLLDAMRDGRHVVVDTMIDNVRIAAAEADTFLWAVHTF